MAITDLTTIKSWFETQDRPTQDQFSNTWDSFWHKYDTIPSGSLELPSLVYSYFTGSTNNSSVVIKYLGTVEPSISENDGVVTIGEPENTTISKFVLHGSDNLTDNSGLLTIVVDQSGSNNSLNELTANYYNISVIERESSDNVQLGLNSSGFQVKHPQVSSGSLTIEITGLNGLVNYSIIGS